MTDERFYRLFNLTKEEIKFIEREQLNGENKQ